MDTSNPLAVAMLGVLVGWMLSAAKDAAVPSQQPAVALRRLVLLFGDSLTERSYSELGWGAGLQHLFQHHADVLCRGFGGYTTRQAVAMLPHLLPAATSAHRGGTGTGDNPNRFLVATVCFGANDAALPTEKVHVPLDEYRANLAVVLEALQSQFAHVIVITQPPVDEARRLQYQKEKYGDRATGYLERTNSVAGEYAKAALEVAAACGAASVDVWSGLQQQDGWRSYLSDGLHYSPKGQQYVLKKVTETLQTLLPAMDGTVLQGGSAAGGGGAEAAWKADFPPHSELDFGNSGEYIATYRKQQHDGVAGGGSAVKWL